MAVLKFFFVLLAVLFYFLSTLLLWPLLKMRPYQTKIYLNRICSFYSKILLRALNVRVNLPNRSVPSSSLIVANHLGYLDVLILSSKFRCSFITSEDIRRTPFLGQICSLAGCLFVNRKNRKNISAEVGDIVRGLDSGMSIGLFPEATSTNGDNVLKFKRSMFQAAVLSESPIAPLTLNYRTVNGEPTHKDNRDYVCWYGEMSFFAHLWALCKVKEVTCDITTHPVIIPKGLEAGELRDLSFELIASGFRSLSGSKVAFARKRFKLEALGS